MTTYEVDVLSRPTPVTLETTVDTSSLPAWLPAVTIRRSRADDDDRSVWDRDGRVRDTLAAADEDWILVRPDGYLSARGSGDVGLRAALDRLTALLTRETA